MPVSQEENGSVGQGAVQTHSTCSDIITEAQAEWISTDRFIVLPHVKINYPHFIPGRCLSNSFFKAPKDGLPNFSGWFNLVFFPLPATELLSHLI